MAPARTFEDLIVWQKGYAFALSSYRFTGLFPKHELFGLTSQMRRAAVSIPANIAEAFKKRGKLDKARFMNMAPGSIEECRCYLLLSRDLSYGNPASLLGDLEEVSRLLARYSQAILNSAR